jgi:hypothetical protein
MFMVSSVQTASNVLDAVAMLRGCVIGAMPDHERQLTQLQKRLRVEVTHFVDGVHVDTSDTSR